MVTIEKLTKDNFSEHSLDEFSRHQVVTECWRCVQGQWQLQPIAFTEDWSLEKRQGMAKTIAENLDGDMLDFGAFDHGRLVGYITLGTEILGSRGQYRQVVEFQVSEEHRGMGIGRQLFTRLCEEARKIGAEKLYISTHSSKESHAAYRKLGCVHAEEIIPAIAEEEPCDVQMEYVL